MLISTTEILGTIPWATYYIVHNAKLGVEPYSWTSTHRHYSEVIQVPASIWKNNYDSRSALELFRWSLVLCAFLFFAFFGFAGEARNNYRRMYASIANRIGYSTSTLHKSSHAYVVHSRCRSIRVIWAQIVFHFSPSSVPYVKNKVGVTVSVDTTEGEKCRSSASFTDQSLIQPISIANDLKPDFKEEFWPSNTVTSSSVESLHEPKNATMEDHSALVPAGTMPSVPPATVPPHLPDTTKYTLRAYSGFDAV